MKIQELINKLENIKKLYPNGDITSSNGEILGTTIYIDTNDKVKITLSIQPPSYYGNSRD